VRFAELGRWPIEVRTEGPEFGLCPLSDRNRSENRNACRSWSRVHNAAAKLRSIACRPLTWDIAVLLSRIVPADGIRIPIVRSGEFGTSPFFGQLSAKQSAQPYENATLRWTYCRSICVIPDINNAPDRMNSAMSALTCQRRWRMSCCRKRSGVGIAANLRSARPEWPSWVASVRHDPNQLRFLARLRLNAAGLTTAPTPNDSRRHASQRHANARRVSRSRLQSHSDSRREWLSCRYQTRRARFPPPCRLSAITKPSTRETVR
jgi:hypothetical protein